MHMAAWQALLGHVSVMAKRQRPRARVVLRPCDAAFPRERLPRCVRLLGLWPCARRSALATLSLVGAWMHMGLWP